MIKNTLIRCMEEAAEFGDRFPDLDEFEVLHEISDICELSAPLEPQWAISRIILTAYNAGMETAWHCAKLWNMIPQDEVYDPDKLYL